MTVETTAPPQEPCAVDIDCRHRRNGRTRLLHPSERHLSGRGGRRPHRSRRVSRSGNRRRRARRQSPAGRRHRPQASRLPRADVPPPDRVALEALPRRRHHLLLLDGEHHLPRPRGDRLARRLSVLVAATALARGQLRRPDGLAPRRLHRGERGHRGRARLAPEGASARAADRPLARGRGDADRDPRHRGGWHTGPGGTRRGPTAPAGPGPACSGCT